MVALDALEQLNAERLRADSRRRSRSPRRRRHRDRLEKSVGERAASSAARRRHARTRTAPSAHHRDRGMQLVGLAAQRRKLLARAGAIGAAWKSAARRAPGSGRRRAPAGRDALPPPPSPSRAPAAPRPSPASCEPGARFDRALVDIGGLDLDRNAGRLQQRAPRRALRSQHQRVARRATAALRSLARRLPAALGQQRHHRGGGFLDRAPRHVDDRPVVLAAELARGRRSPSATACRSIYWSASCSALAARAAGSGGSARSAPGSRSARPPAAASALRASAAPACPAPAECSRS